MKIAVGCDHGGFEHKNAIVEHLTAEGFEVEDFGIYENKSVDYPEIALKVANSIKNGENELGILICGTGIGMSLAANKVNGIRARLHNNSNILCLGGRVIGIGTALELCDIFVNTGFEGGRHQRRVDMITEIEKSNS